MIARLILALMLACFALPAMATGPCHDAPMATPMTGAQHHRIPDAPQRDDKAAVAHACIGCIPPSSWRAAVMPAEVMPQAAPLVATLAAFIAGDSPAPAIPPPRTRG